MTKEILLAEIESIDNEYILQCALKFLMSIEAAVKEEKK